MNELQGHKASWNQLPTNLTVTASLAHQSYNINFVSWKQNNAIHA